MFYNPKSNLVSVSNSILKAFGLKTYHFSFKPLDRLLKANKVPTRKVILILLDGFGSHIQYVYRKEAPHIYKARRFQITSVYPPTTTAATTSLLTGKYPLETGWLGWTEKLPMYEMPVLMFASKFADSSKDTEIKTNQYLPLKELDSLFQEEKKKAKLILGFALKDPTFINLLAEGEKALKDNDLLYLYWTDPDSSLHRNGVGSKAVGDIVSSLDREVNDFASKHPESLILTIADHGHTNTGYHSIYEHPDFFDCLKNPHFFLEPRCTSFLVKDDKKKVFLGLARKYYGSDFYIYSKKQAIEKRIFGLGKPNKHFKELLGDYLFIAKGKMGFSQDLTMDELFVSHHAGSTEAEKNINIGVFNSLVQLLKLSLFLIIAFKTGAGTNLEISSP